MGNILLFINSYEPAGPPAHVVLRKLAERLLADLSNSNSSQPRVMVFGGLSGSGKSFTADQLLMKMFQMSHKTDWIQDLRKVQAKYDITSGQLAYYSQVKYSWVASPVMTN